MKALITTDNYWETVCKYWIPRIETPGQSVSNQMHQLEQAGVADDIAWSAAASTSISGLFGHVLDNEPYAKPGDTIIPVFHRIILFRPIDAQMRLRSFPKDCRLLVLRTCKDPNTGQAFFETSVEASKPFFVPFDRELFPRAA